MGGRGGRGDVSRRGVGMAEMGVGVCKKKAIFSAWLR